MSASAQPTASSRKDLMTGSNSATFSIFHKTDHLRVPGIWSLLLQYAFRVFHKGGIKETDSKVAAKGA